MTTKQIILLGSLIAAVAGGLNFIPMKWGLSIGGAGIVIAYIIPPMGIGNE